MQIKIAALFVFETETLKGYDPQIFDLCSSITGKNYTTCFLNLKIKKKKNPI